MARQRGVVVPISATDNTERAFQQVNERIAELQARVRAAEAGAGGLGRSLGDGMGHAVPQIAAASGAIREFEGTLPIRAVERFLTTTLGLGPVLAAAFPVVGGIAFGEMLFEIGKNVVDFFAKIDAMPDKIKADFAELHQAAQLANDALQLTNDKLETQISKLEHRPENSLKTVLDEDVQSADHLAESLDKAIKKRDDLMKEDHVGFLGRLAGKASTDADAKDISGFDKRIKDLNDDYTYTIDHASEHGATPESMARLKERQLADLQKVYSEATTKIGDRVKELERLQNDPVYKAAGGEDLTARINQARAALQAWNDEQVQIGKSFYEGSLKAKLAPLEGHKDSGDSALKQLEEAQRKAAEQAAQSQADAAKRFADAELSALDEKHSRQLISDRDYYAQRAGIQERALGVEEDAIRAKQEALSDQQTLVSDPAKAVELQTQINALEDQRLKLAQQRTDISTKAGTEDYLATKKADDEALKTAAELETLRGGESTGARRALSDSQFNDRIGAVAAAGGDTSDFLAAQGISDARINVEGANSAYQSKLASLSARRNDLASDERRGLIGAAEAQREKVALDQEEAGALAKLIAAYQQLASSGDSGAQDKVTELQSKLRDLENPINEVTARLRTQFDSAFETLFDNLDKGKKAFDDFGKSIDRILLDTAFRQFIQPGLQAGIGALIPNHANSPSALSALIPGLAKIPGIGVKGTGGGVTVQLINQGAPLTAGGAQQVSGGSDDSAFAERVISVVLKDGETNGPFIQALLGKMGL